MRTEAEKTSDAVPLSPMRLTAKDRDPRSSSASKDPNEEA
jgi:hypothetical protein